MPEHKPFWKTFLSWLSRRHWILIVLVISFFLSMEVYEHGAFQLNVFFLTECAFYTISMLVVGLLAETLLRSLRSQQTTMRILDVKRRINQEAMRRDAEDDVVDQLAMLPSEIAPVQNSCLLVYNRATDRLDLASQWDDGSDDGRRLAAETCWKCKEAIPDQILNFRSCQMDGDSLSQNVCYCLPIRNEGNLMALMRFSLLPGNKLNREQTRIFENIGDDMALALRTGLDRKSLSELRISEASLRERKKVTHFLHDSLGQNLAFLRLKIGQVLAEGKLPQETFHNDLIHMLDVAEDSYEIVRGTLETMVPQTTPSITNLLQEYAGKIARESHFDLAFEVKGKPCEITTPLQQEVFYVFREIFTNIERHSKATRVSVILMWGKCDLKITIQDNGIGFSTREIDANRHFGYRIMQERMDGLKGSISLETSSKNGTSVTINVPIAVNN